MGSDYDYINDHMGGHGDDGLPNFTRVRGFTDNFDDLPKEWDRLYFETFNEAKNWSKANNGKAFTRDPSGTGFIPKETKKY